MTSPRSNQRSTRGFRTSFSARRALLATGLTATAVWACSSSVDLQPVPAQEGMGELNPPFGSAGTGTQVVSPNNGGSEGLPTPMLAPSGTGGAAGNGAAGNGSAGSGNTVDTGTGGSTPMGSAGSGTGGSTPVLMGMAGAPPCADNDQDGKCNEVDPCPDARNDTTDGDSDGLPDACDLCPTVQDDGRDSDGDGIGDACDPCGIGVALGFGPLYYLTLDEDATATTAVNRGSVPQTATYLGPIERGLAGVSDPNGRAIRMAGSTNGEFSRVTFTGINVFPRTALTATFWIRTTRVADAGIFSYAISTSQNEFGIFVDADRLRISLKSSSFIAEDLELSEFADGAWHFMALTWQETVAQFYIDGEAAGSPIQTVPGNEVIERAAIALAEGPIELATAFPPGALVFGQDQDMVNGGFSTAQVLVGGLDEVALYDRALTQDQIRQIFTATTCGEVCDGVDNDRDGITDEGFLGTAAACGAASCADLTATKSAFGTGEYVSTTPDAPLVCNF